MNFRIFKFLFEEAIISLRQNLLMTIVATFTISISLIIMAFFLLLFFNINSVLNKVSNNLNVIIYLDKNIAASGVSKVEEQLTTIAGIKSVSFNSRDEAWKKLKENFQYQEDIVNLVHGNPLPDSFIITLKSTDHIEEVVKELRLIDGVQDIRYGQAVVNRLRVFVQIFNYVGLTVVLFLLFATLLIIINTINLTILSKKNEVNIMKLVGASNNFVKWCFRIEGIIVGLCGSLIAIVAVDFVFILVTIKIQEIFPFISIFTQGLDLVVLDVLLLCLGLFIGMVGSSISIKNLLKSMLKK